jgi:hypothetical protein
MSTPLAVWHHIQRQLFPILQEELGNLAEKDRQFVEVMGLVPHDAPQMRDDSRQLGRVPIIEASLNQCVCGGRKSSRLRIWTTLRGKNGV